MKRRIFRVLTSLLLLGSLAVAQEAPLEKPAPAANPAPTTPPAQPAPAAAAVAPTPAPPAPAPTFAILPLKGELTAQLRDDFKKALADAEARAATGIVVEIDSTGNGEAAIATDIADALLATKLPTVSYVKGRAAAGSALVALATGQIYFHPTASIGVEQDATASPEQTEELATKAIEAAKAKGHPEDVAAALFRRAAKLKRGDQVLDASDQLLVLTAIETTQKYYGHPLLGSGIARDLSAAAQAAGLGGAAPALTSIESSATPAPALGVTPGPQLQTNVGPVFVVPINGMVTGTQALFLRRALKEAQRAQASAVILDIDTLGGDALAAIEQMDSLQAVKIPTYAFVNTKAISAGSMISMATNKIYMHPSAVIGASAVVGGGGEDLSKTMSEKMTSMLVAKVRGAAKAGGHAEDVAEAFVRQESEVIREGMVLDSRNTLLSLNTADATRTFGGKPLLATAAVSSVKELTQHAGLTGVIYQFQPSGFESFASWITTFAPVLLIIGMIGGYIEMKAPGFGFPGIISLIAFGLFFGGHYIAGLAGFESVIVFVIGLALVITEVFIFPGTIVIGLLGVFLMLGSLVWAMVDQWPADGSGLTLPSGSALERPLSNLLLALAGAGVAVAMLAKVLPKTSMYRRLVLQDAVAAGPGITVPEANASVRAGEVGTAITPLRPAGKAQIGSEIYDVVSTGDFITIGASVRILSAEGLRIVVEPVIPPVR